MAKTYDGPTLRAVRESLGIPLRQVARACRMSHGHLSKVERGEYGRPITPAILAAYEKIAGVSLEQVAAEVAEHQNGQPPITRTPRAGSLSDLRRQAFNAAIGALAVGGALGEPATRLIDATGRPVTPTPVHAADVNQLETVAESLTALDLQYGGGLVAELGKLTLRWAVAMLDTVSAAEPLGRRLYAAVAAIAARAAWAAIDTGRHEPARALHRLALYTAVRAGEHNLRAHIIADAAAHLNQIGYPYDTLEFIRLVEGDERLHPAVRTILHQVKARAYATLGNSTACRGQLHLAAESHRHATEAEPDGWLATLIHPGHLRATAGHALAQLAHTTGDPADAAEARDQLEAAIDALGCTHQRARALCQARLAALLLSNGDLHNGLSHARHTLTAASGINSTRLIRALTGIGQAAAKHPTEPGLQQLITDINTATGREPASDHTRPATDPQPPTTTTGDTRAPTRHQARPPMGRRPPGHHPLPSRDLAGGAPDPTRTSPTQTTPQQPTPTRMVAHHPTGLTKHLPRQPSDTDHRPMPEQAQ